MPLNFNQFFNEVEARRNGGTTADAPPQKAAGFSDIFHPQQHQFSSASYGAARSALSSVLTDLGCCHSPANCFDANALTQSVCPVSRESGHARGRFLSYIYHISWRNRALDSFLSPKCARCNSSVTNIRAYIVSNATIECSDRQNFFVKCSGDVSPKCSSDVRSGLMQTAKDTFSS
jgi:hypothetical protein